MDYRLHEMPNWNYEVAACIAENYLNSEDKVIENYRSFGITKDEMNSFFSKYKNYKKAVLSEIMPIFNSYPSIKWLFQPVEYKVDMETSLGLSIVSFWGSNPTIELDDDFIFKMTKKYISTVITDILNLENDDEINIENISDLINILENLKIDDDILKLQLIRLYHTKYETVRQLWEMINNCVPILKKHYPMIKDDVNIVVKTIEEKGNLEKILNIPVNFKLNMDLECDLFPAIFCFNSFKWDFHVEENYSYIGIYFLKLKNLKENSILDEDRLVADLKALSDPTRLKIIRVLLKKEMYLKELAEELGLTSATVSHHTNLLLQLDLISLIVGDKDNRKIYYKVNREKLESIGDSIKRLSKISNI